MYTVLLRAASYIRAGWTMPRMYVAEWLNGSAYASGMANGDCGLAVWVGRREGSSLAPPANAIPSLRVGLSQHIDKMARCAGRRFSSMSRGGFCTADVDS